MVKDGPARTSPDFQGVKREFISSVALCEVLRFDSSQKFPRAHLSAPPGAEEGFKISHSSCQQSCFHFAQAVSAEAE